MGDQLYVPPTQAVPRGRLVLIVRTDVSVLISFVPIWRSFFSRASHHVLIIFEKAQATLFFVLGLFRAVSRNVFWKTIPRVRPVCLQRDAGGLP